MQPSHRDTREPDTSEPPPFLGTWGRVYAALLAYLTLLIALFWLFQRVFTP